MRGPASRWLERIMDFMPFEIEHRPGKDHTNADGLSRLPWSRTQIECEDEYTNLKSYTDLINVRSQDSKLDIGCNAIIQGHGTESTFSQNMGLGPLNGWSRDEISRAQKEDSTLSTAIQWLQQNKRPLKNEMQGASRKLWSLWSQYPRLTLQNGLLYRIWYDVSDTRLQLWLPDKLVPVVLFSLHSCAGHLGQAKTVEKLRQRFHWVNLRNDTLLYIQQCKVCQESKSPSKTAKAPLINMKSGYPLERVGIDIVGPLPKTQRENSYIIVGVDYFTKFPFAFPLQNTVAETVADVLMNQVICIFGVPTPYTRTRDPISRALYFNRSA